ncbi:MAG: DUF3383 family protein [Myxococcales bacterium]|nr:DUF3383 family protein [Myxococcales bacterium]
MIDGALPRTRMPAGLEPAQLRAVAALGLDPRAFTALPEERFGVPFRFPYHLGLYMAVNAIPGCFAVIDGPDCIYRKAEWIHGKHDLCSTLLDVGGRHRVVSTLMHSAEVIKSKGEAVVKRLRRIGQLPEAELVLVNSMPHVQIIGTQYDALIAEVEDPGFTEPVSATTVSPGVFDVTADVAGIPFIAGATSPGGTDLTFETTTANVGIEQDLTAIKAETTDWYLLSGDWRTTPEILLAASLIETDERIYLAQTSDANAQTVGNLTDVGSLLAQLGYLRTSAWYSPTDTQGVTDAIAGLMLPTVPGSETWANKLLSSVTGFVPSSSALASKNYSWLERYVALAPPNGLTATKQGKVASGTYLDIIRGRDYVKQQLQIALARLLLTTGAVRYTDQGGDQGRATIKTTLERIAEETSSGAGAENGFLLVDTIRVTTPSRSQQAAADRADRIWRGLKFSFTLQGAIHAFDVNGIIN